MVALAVALPGGATGAWAGMRPMDAGGPSAGLDGVVAARDEALDGFVTSDHLEAVPVGASSVAEPVRAVLTGEEVIEVLGEDGIPAVAVDGYTWAADRLARDDPRCGIRWTLLAAIGRVESNHGRFGGAQLRDDGYGTRPIRGIPLDGRPNVALIRDTDGGRLDGDTTYDRAVGPMQFIPSTWRSVGADADGDGRRDPDNIFDAAQGAASYLCRGDADLRDVGQRAQAVRRYNDADEYVRVVLDLAAMYESGEVDLLPPVGLPPRTPPPAARPAPEPPRTAPDPERPLAPDRDVDPPPGPDDSRRHAPSPTPAVPRSPSTSAPPAPVPPAPPTPAPLPPEPATPGPATPDPVTPPPTTTAPPVTAPSDEVPPTTSTTVPTQPPASESPPDTSGDRGQGPTDPDAPAEPPAAVGWAPAMREVVVEIVEQEPAADPDPTAPPPPTSDAAPVEGPRTGPDPTAPPPPPADAVPAEDPPADR